MNNYFLCLALILANKGYDVWLGNNRGNTYSRKHLSKLDTSYGYWDFRYYYYYYYYYYYLD